MALYVANPQAHASPRGKSHRAAPTRSGPSLASLFLIAPGLFLKNAVQGAGAGFLTLEGSKRVSADGGGAAGAESSVRAVDPTILDSLTEMARGLLAESSGAGMLLIAGALFLFLTAGKGGGRTIGLLGFVAAVAAYASGYDLAALAPFLQSLGAAGV